MIIRHIVLLVGIFCLLSTANVGAKQPDGKVYLTGDDLSAWRGDTGQWQIVGDAFINPNNEKLLSSKPGTGIVVNGPMGKTTHLISKLEFGDIKTHIEFMISKGSNSGVYFAGRYEVQIYDSYGVAKGEYPGIECGGIYERWDENRRPRGYEGHSPRVNASQPAGQWQVFDVIFRAPRFDKSGKKIANARFEKIVHNGIVVPENIELTGPTRSSAYDDEKTVGPLMLQGDHGPVAYHNIWIEPIGTDPLTNTATSSRSDFWVPIKPPKAHYKIDCSIDLLKGSIEGKEVIHFKNTASRPINQLVIKWLSEKNKTLEIMVDDKPISFLKDPGSEITIIKLSDAFIPDTEINIEVKFSISRPGGTDIDILPLTEWYPKLWWGFETHNDFDVKINAPKEYKIATSGILNNSSGYYHAEGIRYFGVVLLKNSDVLEAKAKNVIVQCYYRPNEKKCAELLLDTATDVINFYRERFGFYPYSSLTIIPGEDRPMGGYPVATNIVSIHGMARMDEMPKIHWQWITAHEVGHQYWLEYVLSKDPMYDIGWLMIGLGIYADREYTRAKGLSMEKHQGLMERYIRGVREGNNTTVNISAEEASEIDFDFNNVVIHGKGYSIISGLDCLLGKDIFSKIYQQCLNEFGGRRLGASEFQAICETQSGQDLGWFFEQWLNSNRYLSYEISSKKCEKKSDIYVSNIEVKRLGNLNMPIPVEATFEDGESCIKFTNRLLDTNILQFESKSPLKDARLDPENALAFVIPPPSATGEQLSKEIQELPWTGAGKQAHEIFEKTKDVKLSNLDDWFKLGLTLYDGKYYAESLKAFQYAADQAEKGSSRYYASKVWQGHNFDLLGQRSQAIECYKEALKCKQQGTWVRHDQYGMVIDQNWVKQRLEEPFERVESDNK